MDQDAAQLMANFPNLASQFTLSEKIGEGTFSCVYKAIDKYTSPPQLVAVKSIHATSSPTRIHNELQILVMLRDSELVCSVITALRQRDQVVVVMPYIEFTDFRDFYMDSTYPEIKTYMYQLLGSLKFVASRGVIHRDVKPTNFLYNKVTQRGVLVDFGLAEMFNNLGTCICGSDPDVNAIKYPTMQGYHRDDSRPHKRANRAGTRGFRAPEVLFKCDRQSDKIDVWAAGVVMLMMMCKRFPFFNSLDDGEAIVEMATIFGYRDMCNTALLHGSMFETNLPTIGDARHPWDQIIDWSRNEEVSERSRDEALAIDLLDKLMELDVRKRPTAHQALEHEFFDDMH